MKWFLTVKYFLIFALIMSILIDSKSAYGQLSPGKLSKAHSQLEGMSNCTACHDLGSKISETKCLNCHAPLKEKIQKNRGYHVSSEVRGKTCITCHSEHHGVNFQMVRFNTKTFNHNLTKYELKGKHKTVDCASCHAQTNIVDKRLKNNKNTFLGLETACVNCHADEHKKTLGQDCAKCHDFNSFKPATLFNHAKTDFPLIGAHVKLECISCHKVENKAGDSFQNFANVPFKNCVSCHNDPHKGSFGTNCKACHSESSFHNIKESGFNHNVTGFALVGKHKSLDCAKCHDNRAGPSGKHKEFAQVSLITCTTCHKDVHDGKFGLDCKKCHNENSFKFKSSSGDFDHNLTGFELEGQHATVDCKKCHKSGNMTKTLPHQTCNACHTDYHNGQFVATKYKDCAACHTVSGFDKSLFSIEDHQNSAFPLTGAHLATECTACHMKTDQWDFRKIGSKCIDCHTNIHDGFLDVKYLPEKNCVSCHNTDEWQKVTFDHDQSNFKLIGKHELTKCASCHFILDKERKVIQKFKQLSLDCVSCHNNVHGDQFNLNGKTDCGRCHKPESWSAGLFEHNSARFKLEGAHVELECNMCHKVEIANGNEIVRYRTGKLVCIDCHQ